MQHTSKQILDEVPNLCRVSPSEATFLGSPIGQDVSINAAITDKVDSLRFIKSRLCLLAKHNAILLLRHCIATPRVLYTLMTAPCFRGNDVLRILIMNFDQCSIVFSTSTRTITWPGHKPSYPSAMERSRSTEQNSLHHLLSWHPLLVAQSSVPPSKTVQHPKPSSGGDCPCVAHGAQPATSPNPREHQAENLWMNHACRPVLKSC